MLSWAGRLYGRFAELRNKLFDRGWLRSYGLGARTISIGNITAGGTGKTPLVALVAEMLAESGERVCILTRGYGRKTPAKRVLVSDGETILADVETGGDEPVELAQRLLGKAVIIADADRVSAASWALRKFGITAFVLDDGFQHRRAKRDLDIVCIDATRPFGGGMLPTGRLREPVGGLKRADAIIITRADLVESTDSIKSEINAAVPNKTIFTSSIKILRLTPLDQFFENDGNETSIPEIGQEQEMPRTRVIAFCGLGNPESFFLSLRMSMFDIDIAETKAFPDHHLYTLDDTDNLNWLALNSGAEALVTTAKDAVKLHSLWLEIPCFVAETEMVIKDIENFRRLIIS